MKIGELAERSGVSTRSLRYYEEQRLLGPMRDASGYRCYEAADVDRVSAIQELYAAGFCSTVVRELLPSLLDPSGQDATRARARFDAARRRLEDELRQVEQELKVLARMQNRLGLAPDTHVRVDAGPHDKADTSPPAPTDHRDRRLR